nr:pyridoxamine 5'-phosphate oxidase family protein [uncultured Gellertiella sp.]
MRESEGATMIVKELTHNACIAVIAAQRLARLGCALDNQPYVVPIHYAYEANRIYGFSLPGKKLDILRRNPRVCLQIEEHAGGGLWKSVVVEALFREFPAVGEGSDEHMHAWSLLQTHADWWEPGGLKPDMQTLEAAVRPVFFAFDIVTVSGREDLRRDAS